MTNKKSKILKISAFFGSIVIGVMFLLMPFMVNNKKSNVYADSVDTSSYTFTSSNLIFSLSSYSSANTDPGSTTDYRGNELIALRFRITNEPSLRLLVYFDTNNLNGGTLIDTFDTMVSRFGVWYNQFYVYYDTGFIPNVNYVRIKSDKWGGSNTSVMETKLYFTDVNDKRFVVCFYTRANADNYAYAYNDRTYYYSTSFNDNTYYQQGLSDGESIGLTNGYNNGYNDGYDNGYSVGERAGFNQGVSSANDYSFLGLFGAIVDAPLQAFTGLFDFNLSFDGVHNFNLKGFFLAILSIAIVIAIVRFAMSR